MQAALPVNSTIRKYLYLGCTFLEAVSVVIGNRIRRFLGRQPPRHPTHVFLRQFLLYVLGRDRPLRLTCASRTDGAGAQAHTIMAAMSFARARGHTYVHTPFKEIDHAEQPMDDWVLAWERLFNLGDGAPVIDSGRPDALNYSGFHPRLYHAVLNGMAAFHGRAIALIEGTGYERRHFHPYFFFADMHPDAYSQVIPELRERFYKGCSPDRNAKLSIAIHLRRGDVTSAHRRRFTPNASVCRTLEQVRSAVDQQGVDYRIRVFSVGPESDFLELKSSGAELCLSRDALWTLRQLVEADILVMSKSSFSYVAALLSDGLILYEPFWHSPMKSWIRRNRRGRFNRNRFSRQLKRLLACGRPGQSPGPPTTG